MAPPPRQRLVLLFCHGGSLHKGVWSPIIQRLQASPLLQRVACESVAFDWRYHGTNACDEEPATLFYEGDDPRSPRVFHPANCWPQWAPEQLVEILSELKCDDDKLGRATKIIGVGHSMGGANLLQFEVLYPGSFEGLVLFEPTLSFECKTFGGAKWAMDMLVKATLAREDKWNSMDEAIAYVRQARVYQRWHPESLDAFLTGAIQQSSDGANSVRLATPLLQEAALYCHDITNYTRKQLARVRCSVAFEYGSHTNIFNLFGVRELVDALPDKFTLGEPLENISHQAVVEAPDECAQKILKRLETFPIITQHDGGHHTSRL